MDLAAEKNLTFTESSCRTEGCMKMDHDRGFCSDSISEDKIWNTDSKQTDCKMMISPLGCYQKSPAKVIVTQDVEQLLFERNQMAKIAYDVCCMFINDKNFNCDQESADSGISEQEEQPVPKKQSKKCDQLAVAPARVTRSQSKTAKTENASTPKTESNPVSSMETFLSTSNAAFQKALLDSVKGTDIGALLDELEQQRAENNRLEKYLVELEQRRNALKLYYATTQNLIFQSEHPGTLIQHIG